MVAAQLETQLADVAERIREHLRQTSCVRVAQDTGVSQSLLYVLQKGEGNPKLATLELLAIYFDRNPDPLPMRPRRRKPAAPKPENKAPTPETTRPETTAAPWDDL